MEVPNADAKMEIAKKFLIPRALANIGINPRTLRVPDETLRRAIQLAGTEHGVRQLGRSIEAVIRKVNLERLLDHRQRDYYTSISPQKYETLVKDVNTSNSGPPIGMYM